MICTNCRGRGVAAHVIYRGLQLPKIRKHKALQPGANKQSMVNDIEVSTLPEEREKKQKAGATKYRGK